MSKNKVPECFGSAKPINDFKCSLCDYASPCGSFAKKFISKSKARKDLEGIIRIIEETDEKE